MVATSLPSRPAHVPYDCVQNRLNARHGSILRRTRAPHGYHTDSTLVRLPYVLPLPAIGVQTPARHPDIRLRGGIAHRALLHGKRPVPFGLAICRLLQTIFTDDPPKGVQLHQPMNAPHLKTSTPTHLLEL